jgi:hypothetical protein
MKTRSPNSRNPKEARNPKPEAALAHSAFLGVAIAIRISVFGLLSDFGFRTSDFAS